MPRNRRYRYTVKVLTPLHIGNGETIPGFAYHVTNPDTASYYWTLLDLEAAAADLLRTGGQADPSLETVAYFAREHPDTYGKYALKVTQEVARSLQQRNIWEHIKLHGKPYLPGSSLKGAIRTALISEILFQGKKAEFEEAVRDSLKSDDVPKPHLTDKAEEAVWGIDPHHDPLRGLRIGDSAEVSPQERLTISDVRVMGFNTSPLELFWEKLGRREARDHLPTPHGATQSFLETFRLGTILEGELSLNTFLLEEPWVKERLDFQGKADLLLPERLREVCQRKYGALFQQELALYDSLNNASNGQLKQAVANLINIQKKEAPGAKEFLLQLSWGTGWRAKTVGEQIDQRFLYEEVNAKERFFQDPQERRYVLADFRSVSHEIYLE